ncbi:MAG: MFS transporter [Alphaproteobacteria bacterium]
MTNRWAVLALLFGVRCAMAFQFQTAAALSPTIMQAFGVGIADIGLLIGLYLSPGVILALPGGGIARLYGDKAVVSAGLALMIVGGLIMALTSSWEWQIIGRVVAGAGGVLLNVLMSKMVADWFVGREIATAMGIFVNSWPVGIAVALVVAPLIADAGGLLAAHGVAAGLAAIGLLALATLYRQRPAAAASTSVSSGRLRGPVLAAVVAAALIWGLYNAALAMIFSFGPALLAERGWSAAAASSATSVALWLVAVSVPLGGFMADRFGQRRLVMLLGFVLFAVALPVAARSDAVLPMFAVLGLVGGVAAGPIMSLPSLVLSAENRGVGMGLFFAIFYLSAVLAPIAAGWTADLFGTAAVTFDLGAVMLLTCCLALWLFDRLAIAAARLGRASGAA